MSKKEKDKKGDGQRLILNQGSGKSSFLIVATEILKKIKK